MKVLAKITFAAMLVLVACAGNRQEVLVRPGPVLVVKNGTQEPIDCFADGWYLGTVKRGERAEFANMRAKKQRITARGLDSGAHYWTMIDLSSRRKAVWDVRSPKPELQGSSPYAIIVRNRQNANLKVQIDGMSQNGVEPGKSRRFGVKSPGRHRVEVVNAADGLDWHFITHVQAGVTPVLDIGPALAVIRARNTENKGVYVAIDHGASRMITPGRATRFKDVKPGKHRIEFAGVDGQMCGEFDVAVKPGQELTVEPRCPKSELMAINDTDKAVEIRLGSSVLTVCAAKGAVDVGNLPTGTLRLEAWSGPVLVARVTRSARPGQKLLWMIRQGAGIVGNERLGTLLVYNKSNRDVDLWVDKVKRGTIQKGRNLLLASMTPGDHAIYAYCPATGTVWSAEVHYDGNERLKWTVDRAFGSLRMKNQWGEPISILLDGSQTLKMKKGQEKVIQLSSGTHVLEVTGSGVDLTQKVLIPVIPQHWASVVLRKPVGTLIVHNAGHVPLSLTLDEKEIGVLQPDGDVKMDAVASGTHTIVGITLDSKAKWLNTVRIPRGKVTTVEIGK